MLSKASPHLKCGYRRSQPPGFTLIEIMLVLVIIGVVTAMASLSLHPNPATQLDREARRLQAALNQASEQAELQGLELALSLSGNTDTDDQQYQFLVLDKQSLEWVRPDSDDPLVKLWSAHTLNRNISLELQIEGQQLGQQELEQITRVQSLAAPNTLHPSILLLSSGEITPFTLRLGLTDYDYTVQLSSDGISGVLLQ